MSARCAFGAMDAEETAAGSSAAAAAKEVVEQTPPPKVSKEHKDVDRAQDDAEGSKNNEDPDDNKGLSLMTKATTLMTMKMLRKRTSRIVLRSKAT